MNADRTGSNHNEVSAWRLWENPVLRRYVRSRLRSRDLGVGLCITLVLSAFI
ncbi:MAG: hypothetical protein RIS24_1914, partial [Verrucomicrobiota bacterium]